jgi:hemoglobin-like flavoprotein/ferredoxin-NADP reductase
MRPEEQQRRHGVDVGSYDQWLAWEHGLRLRRARAADGEPRAPGQLEWGDQALIEASLGVVAPVASQLVAYFYECLFAEQPRLRGLFPDDMTDQRERLLTAVLALVQDASDPDSLVERLKQLGRDHRKFGARPAHYASVGKALVAALSTFAGDAWTPAIEQAWLARYTVAATAMLAAADADTQPPYWYASVVGHERRGDDLAIIRVRLRHPYPYMPGQYATLTSERLRRVWRPYTMATAAAGNGELEFHVRANRRGGLSDVLVAATSVGDSVRVGAPQGIIGLRPANSRIQVFVESGIGWAVTKAFLDQLSRRGEVGATRPVLIHVGQNGPYDQRWTEVRDRCPGLATVAAASPDEVLGCLAEIDPVHLEVYLSGPQAFTGAVAARLAGAGVAAEHILVTSWPGA